jgi:hypothetical protein
LLVLGAAAVGGAIRIRQVEQKAKEAEQKAAEVEQKAEKEMAVARQELALSDEFGANWRKANEWEGIRSQFALIHNWLEDGKRADKVRLAPNDRRRLRRAMLEEVLLRIERAKPIPFDPQLSISLLLETSVRLTAANTYAEFDRPAASIPHAERAVKIQHYLGSPDSGLTHGVKPTMKKAVPLYRVKLVDLRERAGAVESLEAEASEVDEILKQTGESLVGTRQALAAVRGTLLGRRGEFAAGEKLLLTRYEALTRPGNPARELNQGEKTATVRRLVNLYAAWGRKNEVKRWTDALPREGLEQQR